MSQELMILSEKPSVIFKNTTMDRTAGMKQALVVLERTASDLADMERRATNHVSFLKVCPVNNYLLICRLLPPKNMNSDYVYIMYILCVHDIIPFFQRAFCAKNLMYSSLIGRLDWPGLYHWR